MGWIVISVLLGIVFWGGIIAWGVLKSAPAPNGSIYGVVTAGCAAVLWVIISVAMSVHTVGQREVAIVYNFSGTISGKKDAGVVTTMPWQHIKKENIGIQHEEWTFDNNNAAVSVDQQKITAVISVNYQIDPQEVVDLYKRVGSAWKSIIIDARVPQVFKETTATFKTPDLTAEREKLRLDTKTRLTDELAPYDIKVVDVFIRNLGFSQSYTDAIERKQKQAQDAQTAQAKVAQVEAEARQQVAEAEGAANAAIAKAKGEATANIARARGDATANRLRNRTLTDRLLRLAAIEKLNPDVQVIVCPPQSVCIPNSGVIPQP